MLFREREEKGVHSAGEVPFSSGKVYEQKPTGEFKRTPKLLAKMPGVFYWSFIYF